MMMFLSLTVESHDIMLIVARAGVKQSDTFSVIRMISLRENDFLMKATC